VSSYIREHVQRLLFKREVDQFHHKGYTPNGFRKQVKEAGFTLRTCISHHFVFFPIDYLVPKLSIQLDYILTRLFERNFLFARFGKTFIIDAVKPNTAGLEGME
jgi:hypothetical protein